MKSFRNTVVIYMLFVQYLIQSSYADLDVHNNPVTFLGQKTQVLELIEGSPLELSCTSNLNNNSAVNIEWKFNGQPLMQVPHIDGSLSNLSIVMTSFDQGGEYSCGFLSDTIELWEHVNITFGRKPPAVRNLRCIRGPDLGRYNTIINCTWLPGNVDTNLPTTYRFEYREDAEHFFSLDDYYPESFPTQELYYLSKYKGKRVVSVLAENELGTSNRSTQSFSFEVIPPENVYGSCYDDKTLLVNWDLPPYHLNNNYIISYKEVFPKETNAKIFYQISMYQRPKELEIFTGYREYEVQVAIDHYQEDKKAWSDRVTVKKNETDPTGQVGGSCNWKDEYSTIVCHWNQLPIEKHNGRLLGYSVAVFSDDNVNPVTVVNVDTVKHSNATLVAEFQDLIESIDYTVNISAYNSAGSTVILSVSVAGQPSTGVGKGYIILIVCVSALFLISLALLIVRSIIKAGLLKPLPEPKFFYTRKWETRSCEQHQTDVEIFDEIKTRNVSEKGDPSERTSMLPETGCEALEGIDEEGDHRKTSTEVTNFTYLILGRKYEQQNNNVFQPDLSSNNCEMNSSQENSDDVCYLQLHNGNLLAEVPQTPIKSIAAVQISPGSVPYSEEGYESFLIDKTMSSSGNYISGSGTSCLTADTQLSSS